MKHYLLTSIFCFITISLFSQLKISLNDIDDVGFAAVIPTAALETMNSSTLPVDFQVEWNQSNGNGSKDLFNRIPSDGGVLIVGLWNKVFKGWWGGKYSYNISAYLNNSLLFSDSQNVSNNTEGMKYFKAYYVTKDGEAVDLSIEMYRAYEQLMRAYSAKFSGSGSAGIDYMRIGQGVIQLSQQMR